LKISEISGLQDWIVKHQLVNKDMQWKEMKSLKNWRTNRSNYIPKVIFDYCEDLYHLGMESNTGMRDIRLENVSMALGSLELLNEVTLTIADGRKYGLDNSKDFTE
jgi:hypothetical protein